MKTFREKYREADIDYSMSNVDHEISSGLEEYLKNNTDRYAEYPCWNCFCLVKYDKRKKRFLTEVWTCGSISEIRENKSLSETMADVSSIYGYR